MRLPLLILALAAALCRAQAPAPYFAVGFSSDPVFNSVHATSELTGPSGSSLPGTCAVGDVFTKTADAYFYVCTSVNTWSRFSKLANITVDGVPFSSTTGIDFISGSQFTFMDDGSGGLIGTSNTNSIRNSSLITYLYVNGSFQVQDALGDFFSVIPGANNAVTGQETSTATSSTSSFQTLTYIAAPTSLSSAQYAGLNTLVRLRGTGGYSGAVGFGVSTSVLIDSATPSWTGGSLSVYNANARISGTAYVSSLPTMNAYLGSQQITTSTFNSSCTVSAANLFQGAAMVCSGGATGTITTTRVYFAQASTAGTCVIGTSIGLDVAAMTAATTAAYGIRVAKPTGATTNQAMQFSDTSGSADGGITFGTTSGQSNLYRSAASTLKTDTAFEVGTALKVDGNAGFFGTTPTTKPTITGSRGGNAALASFLTGMSGLGLLTDSTTA